MPSEKYIEAAKAGARPVDLVRLTRRSMDDIHRSRIDWEAALEATDMDLDISMDQVVLGAEQVRSEGHEGGSGHVWQHVLEINVRGQILGHQSRLIKAPVLDAGLIGEISIRCKNQKDTGELMVTVIPNLNDKFLANPSLIAEAEQYAISKPVQAAEAWLTFDFSPFGIVKESGSAVGLLLQAPSESAEHAGVQLWQSIVSPDTNEMYWGRGASPSKWVPVVNGTRCVEFRIMTQGHKPSGSITLKHDLGGVPGAQDVGEWHLATWSEPGAAVSVSAWASATGAFAGEEASLGQVADGTAITNKTRYYKLKIDLTSSPDQLGGVGVIEAGPRFTRSETFATGTRPIWGYPNTVGEISINEGEVKPEEGRSSAQKPYVIFTDPEIARRLQEYDYQGEELSILRGYDHPGFTPADCEVRARARIADYAQDEKVELETIDILRDLMDLELPAPAEDPEEKTIVNVRDQHPADAAVLLMCRAGVRPSLIDSTDIAAFKAISRIADIRVRRVLTERAKLKDILDDLLGPLLSAVHERGGKIRISRMDWDAEPVAVIDAGQVRTDTERFTPQLREGRGWHALLYGERGGLEGRAFTKLAVDHDPPAMRRFSGAGKRLEYAWLAAERIEDAERIAEDLTYARKSGLPVIEVTVDLPFAWLLPGMTVEYESRLYRRRGATNTNPLTCLVQSAVPVREGVELRLVVLKDAQSDTPGEATPIQPPFGFTVTEIDGGFLFGLGKSLDSRVTEHRVYESLAGAERWSLMRTLKPSEFSGWTKAWERTDYNWLGNYDFMAVAVSGSRTSEPILVRGKRVRSPQLEAPECSLDRIGSYDGVYMIYLTSLPAGAVDVVIEHKQYAGTWERIERTGSLEPGELLTAWEPPPGRPLKIKSGAIVDFFRVAAVDKYGQAGSWSRELFIAAGTQLALGAGPAGPVVFDPEHPPEVVHQLHGSYFRPEVRLTLLLPEEDVDRAKAIEIWRRDNGGSGETFGAWERLDLKTIERDEATAPPAVVEYRDWRQIKAGWIYEYQARMIDMDGIPGEWSEVERVAVEEDTTPPDKPSILSVMPVHLKNLVMLSEPQQGGVRDRTFSHAQIQAQKEGSGTWVDVDAQTVSRLVEHDLAPADMGSRYKYRARYYDSSENVSQWSNETGWNLVLKVGLTALDDSVNSLLTQVTVNQGNITTHASLISQTAQEVALRAYSSTVSAIDGRLTTAEGSISVMAGQIALKVAADGVIAAINLSPEEIRITGAKLHVTANTAFDSDVAIQGILTTDGGLKTNSGTTFMQLSKIGDYDELRAFYNNQLLMRLRNSSLSYYSSGNEVSTMGHGKYGVSGGFFQTWSYDGQATSEINYMGLWKDGVQVVGGRMPAISNYPSAFVSASSNDADAAKLADVQAIWDFVQDMDYRLRVHGLYANPS